MAEIPANLVDSRTAGKSDARPGIQAVLDAGGRVLIGPGDHRFGAALKVDPGAVIYLAAGARLLKNFSASGAVRSAGIQNRKWGNGGPAAVTQVPNVRIEGPGEYSAVNESMRGNLIGLYGNNISLRDFTTKVWEGGRHTVLAGDHCRADNLHWVGGGGSTGNGGLRFQGGTDFICTNSHCESGDDVWQFVPAGAEADPTYGLGISDSVYRNCTGSSTHAKLCVIGLQFGGTAGAPDGVVTMPASAGVWRSGFVNCRAPDGTAITARIQNISGAGPIEDCYIDGVVTKGMQTPSGQAELFINAWEKTGGITRFKVSGLRMQPLRQPLAIQRGCVDTTFTDCVFPRGSQNTGLPVAKVTGLRTKFTNCTFDGKDFRAAVVAVEKPSDGGGNPPQGVSFTQCRFINVNGTGVDLQAGNRTTLDRCEFEGTGNAVKFSGATRTRLIYNDYNNLTVPKPPSDTVVQNL